MTFTGTLIESLMATVERVELKTQPDAAFVAESMMVEASTFEASIEPSMVEAWLASVQENTDYDPKFLGVA